VPNAEEATMYVPNGYETVFPCMIVSGADELALFLEHVSDA
jgi:hypothetical protein